LIEIDLAEVTESILASPNNPGEVNILSEAVGSKIKVVFIGSCYVNFDQIPVFVEQVATVDMSSKNCPVSPVERNK
jgi:aconitase B